MMRRNLWTPALTLLLLIPSVGESSCPGGNESTLAKDYSITGHVRERYADYPWVWDKCVELVEQNPTAANPDNRDERVYSGNVLERDKSCNPEGQTQINQSWTYSINFTASTGGSLTATEKAELGFDLDGVVSGSGSSTVSGSVNWEVGVAETLSMTGTVVITIPGGTYYREDGYLILNHRKGGRYTYVQIDVWDWCDTHSVWSATPYYNELDIYSLTTDTHTQPGGGGVAEVSCTGCGCTPPAFPKAPPFAGASPQRRSRPGQTGMIINLWLAK